MSKSPINVWTIYALGSISSAFKNSKFLKKKTNFFLWAEMDPGSAEISADLEISVTAK